jgi:hypothetical protein
MQNTMCHRCNIARMQALASTSVWVSPGPVTGPTYPGTHIPGTDFKTNIAIPTSVKTVRDMLKLALALENKEDTGCQEFIRCVEDRIRMYFSIYQDRNLQNQTEFEQLFAEKYSEAEFRSRLSHFKFKDSKGLIAIMGACDENILSMSMRGRYTLGYVKYTIYLQEIKEILSSKLQEALLMNTVPNQYKKDTDTPPV